MGQPFAVINGKQLLAVGNAHRFLPLHTIGQELSGDPKPPVLSQK